MLLQTWRCGYLGLLVLPLLFVWPSVARGVHCHSDGYCHGGPVEPGVVLIPPSAAIEKASNPMCLAWDDRGEVSHILIRTDGGWTKRPTLVLTVVASKQGELTYHYKRTSSLVVEGKSTSKTGGVLILRERDPTPKDSKYNADMERRLPSGAKETRAMQCRGLGEF